MYEYIYIQGKRKNVISGFWPIFFLFLVPNVMVVIKYFADFQKFIRASKKSTLLKMCSEATHEIPDKDGSSSMYDLLDQGVFY